MTQETLLERFNDILEIYSEHIHIAERTVNNSFQGSLSYVHPDVQKLEVIRFKNEKSLIDQLNAVTRRSI